MHDEMVARLLALNRRFYAAFADQFAASRSVSDPALTAILPYLPSAARVLDVGCGNGRLALLLDQQRPGSTYVGVDAVAALIEEARSQALSLTRTEVAFAVLDVAEDGWTDGIPSISPATSDSTSFDCVVALAVLHHIPSLGLRAQVVRQLAGLVAAKGQLIISTWRFLAHERMRRKIVDWLAVGIDETQLEPGDYLLDWARGGRGYRYCHHLDEGELKQLAVASGLSIRETFVAGGREGDLSLFAILERDSVNGS